MNRFEIHPWIGNAIIMATIVTVITGLASTAVFAQGAVLFEENFDALALGPNVDEALANGSAFTNATPAGWTRENDMPDGGVTEWRGWSFADKDWWVATAGDQRRSEFASGENVVAVADPDEWDDIGNPAASGTYNTSLSTPAIDISRIPADALQLTFDSSWRPEVMQTASVSVSFDGGPAEEILLMESTAPEWTTHLTKASGEEMIPDGDQIDETRTCDIPNPAGAGSMVITWRLFDAGNNWWWAFDNVQVTTTAATAVEAAGKLATYWGSVKQRN